MGVTRNWLLTGATALALGLAVPSSAPAQLIYGEDFETGDSLEDLGFTVYDFGDLPPTWELRTAAESVRATSRVAHIHFDSQNPLLDFLVTPGFELQGGQSYELRYTVSGGGNAVFDEMDVYLWDDDLPDQEDAFNFLGGELITTYDFDMGTELAAANTPRFEEFTLTPSTTGTYHLVFYARSQADQFFIWVDDILIFNPDGPPIPSSSIFPADGATNVNQLTYIHIGQNATATRHTVFFSDNEADVIAGTAPKILDDEEGVFFADPGPLAGNTTYYYRIDSANANGPTEGETIFSFTTRPDATSVGDVYFFENFDTVYFNPPTPGSNFGYPELPKGWDTLDVDGAMSAIGVPIGWYISPNRPLSAPNAVQTRRNTDGEGPGGSNTPNDDWLFFPEIQTHPTLDTVMDFNMRTRIGTISGEPTDDTVEVYWTTTGTNSMDPADYVYQDTIVTSSVPYITYRYTLPQGESVRFALRYVSEDRAQILVDDVQAQILTPPPALALLAPADEAEDVNIQSWLVSPSALGLTSLQLFFGTDQTAVANGTVTPLDPVEEGAWYFDPGDLQGSTTYYAMLRTENDFGPVDGPVTSFTTRQAVADGGNVYFFEDFDAHPYSIDAEPPTSGANNVNVGYPAYPKGWDALDADGNTTRYAGAQLAFYVFQDGRSLSAPNALWSRGSDPFLEGNDGQTDDWIFLPPVQTHPTLETVIRLQARGGFTNFVEVADIVYSTDPTSTDPADYTNLLGTIETDPAADQYFIWFPYEFTLPADQEIRVAINCRSFDASRFIVDDITILVLTAPEPQTLAHPAPDATNVNQVTYLYLPSDEDIDSFTLYFSANESEVENMTVTPLLEDSEDVFFADPGTLDPATTYYARVVAKNEFGTTNGPVTSFTTRATPTAPGHVYFFEDFDAPHLYPRSGDDVNVGYPDLPKGWETVDVDGLVNRAGFTAGFYVDNVGAATFKRSQPAALWSRGKANGQTDEWIFLPPVDTHPTEDTILRVWARGGANNFDELGEVWYSNNTSSIDPSDYTERLGDIDISEPPYLTYQAYDFLLPKGESVRVGINCLSFDGSRFILDDISVFIPLPPPELELARPVDGATGVPVREYLYLQTDTDVDSRTVYLSTVESEVENMSIAPIAQNIEDVNFVDPGDLMPGTTYYARIVSSNESGSTPGPVTSFTTLPTPTEVGDRFFLESFIGPHFVTGEFEGYPSLPKGWDSLDLDGANSNWTGAPESWFIFSNISRARTGGNALVGFYNTDESQNDDWVFLPEVEVPADTIASVRFWARVRSASFPETVEVYASTTGTNSTDPADYDLIDTLQDLNNLSYIEFPFELPVAEKVRVALRYTSTFQWYVLVDDVEIFISSAGAIAPELGDINGDGVVNVADVTALANALAEGLTPPEEVADINGDGVVDEADIQALADMIVNN